MCLKKQPSLLIIRLGVRCKSFLMNGHAIGFSRTTVIRNRPYNRAFVYSYLISIWASFPYYYIRDSTYFL